VALSDSAYGHNAPALTVTALLAAHHRHTHAHHSTGPGAISDSVGRAAGAAWDVVPARPPARPRCAARVVHLVSSVAGRLACPPRHVRDTVRVRVCVCVPLSGPSLSVVSFPYRHRRHRCCHVPVVVDVVGPGAAAGVAAAVVLQVRR
jgi:hypothetical protein